MSPLPTSIRSPSTTSSTSSAFSKEKQISVLITDHNAREIFSIVDRSYLIREGKVMMSGTVDELLQSKEARSSYFGEDFRL